MTARILIRLILAAGIAFAAAGACAQTWPSKPVTIAITTAAGGPNDLISRVIAFQWEKKFDQRVLVESRPGGGGTVAVGSVVRSAPDGHTLVIGSAPMTTSLFVKDIPYDPFKDVVPVSVVAVQYYYLLVSRKMNIRTLKDLVAYAKANPGALSIGMVPAGPHEIESNVMLEVFNIKANLIGYKGLAPVYPALVAGELNATLGTTPPALKTGEIVGLGLGGNKRNPDYPDIPTFREGGFAYDPTAYFPMSAPAATPKDLLNRIAAEVAAAVKSEEFANRLTKTLNIEGFGSTPDYAAKYMREDYDRSKRIADRLGIKPQ